jgi:transcriptional coactivator HFI1/ADA1
MSNSTIPYPIAGPSHLNPASQTNGHASSSHIPPSRLPIPFQRADTQAIKQELHDALGENGLAYWKALKGYLLGQLSRGELESMVRRWLKTGKGMSYLSVLLTNANSEYVAYLHNRLLLSLLHNASAPSLHSLISPNTGLRKRRRVGYDDPEYDVDESYIEPRGRVQGWMSGISRRDIARIRRAVVNREEEGGDGDGSVNGVGVGGGSASDGYLGRGNIGTASTFTIIHLPCKANPFELE